MFRQVILGKNYKSTNLAGFEIKGAADLYFIEIHTKDGKLEILKVLKE